VRSWVTRGLRTGKTLNPSDKVKRVRLRRSFASFRISPASSAAPSRGGVGSLPCAGQKATSALGDMQSTARPYVRGLKIWRDPARSLVTRCARAALEKPCEGLKVLVRTAQFNEAIIIEAAH
jgi:hypothetical protein